MTMASAQRLLAAAVAAALALCASGAVAQERYWYDGERRRPLWAEPDAVADFAAPTGKATLRKPAAATADAKRSSPVFRDGASAGSAKRALPGGVLLRLRPGTSPDAAQALLARHGLTLRRTIGDGSGMLLVEAPPGVASLELANRLYESGDFAAASPNWWRPRALK